MNWTYRPEIDGLRAIAVLSVILFHFERFGFGGGFIGVDIFFVISGFLITSISVRQRASGTYAVGEFYERRIRRILPALFVVLAASCLGAWIVLLPRHMESFGKSLLASLTMSANAYFLADSGYFADDANFKPLLHTWSLAVEEQFYLLFPFVIGLALAKGPRFARNAILTLAVLSFVAGQVALGVDASAAFYLPQFRAWELLLGALLGLGDIPLLTSSLWRNLVASVGAAAIAFAVFAFDERTPFPGYAALLPCIGTACIIHAGSSGPSWVGRLLSLRLLVLIGLASYSLYLWHWPLVVFTRHALIAKLRIKHTNALLWITPVLGFPTWYFIERPLRRRGSRRQVFVAAATGFGLLAAFGVAALATQGFEFRAMNAARQLVPVARPTTGQYMRSLCRGDGPVYGRVRTDLCRLGSNDGTPSFFLWGDSHAQGVAPVLEEIATAQGRTGLASLAPACAPLLSLETGPCATPSARAALDDPEIRNVILHMRWATWADPSATRGVGDPTVLQRGMKETLSAAQRYDRRVTVIASVPEANGNVPDAVVKSLWLGIDFDVRPTVSSFLNRQRAAFQVLRTLQKEFRFTIEFPHRVLCPGTHCDVTRDGKVLYTDTHHLSEAGVLLLRPILTRALELPRADPGSL